MNLFLRASIIIVFSLLIYTFPKRYVSFVNGHYCASQDVFQKYFFGNDDKHSATSTEVLQFFEETDDDDESSVKLLSFIPQKDIKSHFYQKYPFINILLFQFRNVFRYSRCIHFQSFII